VFLDDLVAIIVVVAFIKLFIVENYTIPSGSMTPTLYGGLIAEVDVSGDGREDLLFWSNAHGAPIYFEHTGERLEARPLPGNIGDLGRLRDEGHIRTVRDLILVNKLAYWFAPPSRGDVAVFKVPERIWTREAPVFVKRVAGLGGERIAFASDGALMADAHPVSEPSFFDGWTYDPVVAERDSVALDLPYMSLRPLSQMRWRVDGVQVPPRDVLMLGDNTAASRDGRSWGTVPVANLRGRAFLRLLPLDRFGWID
jgi:signal peptidase I